MSNKASPKRSRYRVKISVPAAPAIYGVVDEFSDRAKRLAEKGTLVVLDAVLPKCWLVQDGPQVADLQTEFGGEYDRHVEREFNKARALSQRLGEGLAPGKLFSVPVADGAAWYVVTKVGTRTCRVEWRGFSADRWSDRRLGFGRSIPLSDARRMVGWADGMRKLFARKGT